MNVLLDIQAAHRRVRKLKQATEFLDVTDSVPHRGNDGHEGTPASSSSELAQAEEELRALEANSPATRLWRLFDDLFPVLLTSLDSQNPSCLAELQGFRYFPMDQPLFLDVQSFVSGLRMHLEGEAVDSCAIFYRGNLLWSSEALSTVRTLYAFLRLREGLGVNGRAAGVADRSSQNEEEDQRRLAPDGVWMEQPYRDTFLPVWSSKTSYAECAVAEAGANAARKSARSIHKLSSVSISTMLANETTIGPSAPPASATTTGRLERRRLSASTLKASVSSVSFRNGGLLLQNGYFARPSELPKPPRSYLDDVSRRLAPEAVWSPVVFPLSAPDESPTSERSLSPRRVVMWHDAGLSLLVFFRGNEHQQQQQQDVAPRLTFSALDKLADYLDSNDRLSQLAALVLARYLDTVSRAPR